MVGICLEIRPNGFKSKLLAGINSFRSAFGPGGQEDPDHGHFGKIVDTIYDFIGESSGTYIDLEEVIRFLVAKNVISSNSERDIEVVKNFLEGLRKDGLLKTSEPGSGIYRII